ncbi:sulfotransferase [Alteromonas sp. ASW11-19]|uniref:Sulfotransferase n=1 Tax=Alteromonas salexigens TaxID=2982530 RepID=A0ABT2VJT0_9ALTE|nr:tetratricopeptide repeat-containing sulfotransferase family protein [Alteromonas salexigens]MCU7553275.1 sulfotransferase [Alteromonas salexigens]
MKSREDLLTQARQAINQRNFIGAHKACVMLIQHYGDDAHAYFLLGIVHIELGHINKAIRLLQKSISLARRPRTFVYLAKSYALKGDMLSVLEAAGEAPVEQLDRSLDLDTLGGALSRVGDHTRARPYLEKALGLSADNPAFYYNYAVSCKCAGDFEAARRSFERAIALKPDYYQAHFALSDLAAGQCGDARIAQLCALQDTLRDHVEAGLHLGHALAKEYEAQGDYGAAFAALEQAKARKRKQFAGAGARFQALFDYLEKPAAPRHFNRTGVTSDRPIFVVGMPRSGTTLVERILSSHSEVGSAGEIEDFGVAVKELCKTSSNQVLDLATLTAAEAINPAHLGERYLERTSYLCPNNARVVDKLPFNFFYIGLIRQAFPNARIVCMMRHPMDTCMGNYRQLFSVNSPYYAYAYDLREIGLFYQRFAGLMQALAAQHSDHVRLQSYEALVTQPESEVQDLLNFCNLSWQPQCLQVEKNPAPVSTASKVQVREPINTRSIGRWKHYAPYTPDLQQLLTSDE